MPTCQWLYIITFGGGLVEGDNVAVDVKVGENCTVVVTTQATTKVTETTWYNKLQGNTHSSTIRMIRFRALGTYLLLLHQGRLLIRIGALIRMGHLILEWGTY